SLFHMLRLPSISSLFPYTTLFRSSVLTASIRVDARFEADIRAVVEGDQGPRCILQVLSLDGAVFIVRRLENWKIREPLEPVGRIDRKSTRLNSSHQISSYAVFYLK